MRKFALPLALLSLLAACASQPTSTPRTSTRESSPTPAAPPPNAARLDQELRSNIAALRGPDRKRIYARLKRLTQASPRSPAADEARMALGEHAFETQSYADAYNNFSGITGSYRYSAATLKAARCLVILRKGEDAIRMLDRRTPAADSADQAQEARRIRYEAAVQTRRNLDALRALVELAENAKDPAERERYIVTAADAVDNRLSEDDVKKVADSPEFGALRANAKLRHATLLLDQRQFPKARAELGEAVELAKQSEVAQRAQKLIDQLDTRQKVEPRTIGLVVPLSGKQAAIGYRTMHGLQLGLGIYGKVQSGLRLAVIDSEGNPDVARRAVERLVTEDGAMAIVGGVLSKTAPAEAAKAQELGIPAIMLSQKSGVTQAGDAIFRNAFTSQMQVQRLVEIAMDEMHYSRFAIMFPNDAYGAEYANLFWDEVKARGGQIVGAQPYDPKANDFRPYVQRLAGVYYVEDRYEEYKQALRKWQQKNPKRSTRNAGPSYEELIGPIADFEALFVPDSADAAKLIAPALPLYDLDNVRLLGTNLWNRPELVEHKNRDIEKSIFVDSVSPVDASSGHGSDFANSYKAAFGEEPGVFELQAYDSGLILRQIIASGENTRSGIIRRLAELRNFPGAVGSLSVLPNREIKRPSVGLVVQDGKIEPLDTSTQRR